MRLAATAEQGRVLVLARYNHPGTQYPCDDKEWWCSLHASIQPQGFVAHIQVQDGLVVSCTRDPRPLTYGSSTVPPDFVVGSTPLLQVGYGITKLKHKNICAGPWRLMVCQYATWAT